MKPTPDRDPHTGIARNRTIDAQVQSTAGLLWGHGPNCRDDAAILILNANGFVVDCVDRTSAGLTSARERANQVISVDPQLSGAAGSDVLQRLHDAQTSPPVIVLTGSDLLDCSGTAQKLCAAGCSPNWLSGDHLAAVLWHAISSSTRPEPAGFPPLAEALWREAVCHEFASCTTTERLMTLILDALCDQRLTLRAFFGCAQAWRTAWADGGNSSVTDLASKMAVALRESTRTRLPTHPKLQAALRGLELGGRKQPQSLFARQNGLSRTYLSRRLKAETGREASAWCRASVMRSAFREVVRTPELIKRIADNHGYQHADGSPDSSQFDHDFVNTFGLSPRELRRTWTRLHTAI